MMAAYHFMKTVLRKIFNGRKKRWMVLTILALGVAVQICGKCLPTLVVCYKANEEPKIEFWQDGCDCRRECANYFSADCREGCANFRSACLDVPLLADSGCGPPPRLPSLQNGQSGRATGCPAAVHAQAPLPPLPDTGMAPTRGQGKNDGSHLFPGADKIHSFFCRHIC
jgi:hypothetical protein